MKLEYVGPSVLVSSRGVSFDENKKDKFIYLHGAAVLLDAIDHDYVEDKVYVYTSQKRVYSGDALLKQIRHHCNDIDRVIGTAQASARAYINAMVKRAGASGMLSAGEQSVYVNNIELMRTYMLQRYINKRVYYHVVEHLAMCIQDNRIAYVSAPMNGAFFHLLNTLQRTLRQQKSPADSQITFDNRGDTLSVRLSIIRF